jgi:DUF4097 and DUF4098 domain-containing protein YvlB
MRMIGGLAVVALALPSSAGAQSLDRTIDRLVESITASAERLAERLSREADYFATEFDRRWSDKRFRNRDWDDDRDRDGKHHFNPQNAASRLDTTITFTADGTVDLSNISGEINVTGWDRKEVRIKAYSERGRIEWDLSSSRVTLEVRSEHDSRRSRGIGETRYDLSVPRGVRVIAHSTSGEIILRGTGGNVEANSTSGDVTVEDASRRVEIGTVSGDISAKRIKGNLEIGSVSGDIEMDDVEGDVRMETTSGDMTLTKAHSREVDASTTSGEIVFEGLTVDPSGRYEFHSHSGTIAITIPGNASAKFSLETFSGEIDSDFPITLQPGDRGGRRQRRFEFNVGEGGARIIAETFSGDVEIRKTSNR